MDFDGAKEYALRRLREELPPALTYHNLAHTQDDVIPAVQRLSRLMGLGGEETASVRLLLTAAYYHDIGQIFSPDDHEARAVQIIRAVLPGYGYSDRQIDTVGTLIMATRVPQNPGGLMGAILADADLDVLGREDFFERNRALRDELAALGRSMSDAAWYENQVGFLAGHRYFTSAARDLRDAQKARNLSGLRRLLALALENPPRNAAP